MWQQNYTPIHGSLALSSLLAALPILVLLYLLGVRRKAAWITSLAGLAAATLVALAVYRMPVLTLASAIGYGAAFGLFPIGWIVFTAILLFRVTVESGQFEIIKESIGRLSEDRRLQALLIAFAFGAFVEGASGFGTPIAVAAAMLAGLGFPPFYAAGLCLLANTAPVAFGAIGTPVLTLAAITGLPLDRLSAGVGRICAPASLILPAYIVFVMGGWKALRGAFLAVLVCGAAFAGTQLAVSNLIGPQITDILSSLAALGALVLLLSVWKPKDGFTVEGMHAAHVPARRYSNAEVLRAWGPYILLVLFVLVWGVDVFKTALDRTNLAFNWPALHNQVLRTPPVVAQASPYAARYQFNWLSTPGTACLLAALLSALVVLKISLRRFALIFWATMKQLFLAELTIAAVLAIAFLMNYCGATATLGLAFAATGRFFPFFSALLGWLGVFLTGSDTSANALFGNLQVITANRLGLNPVLMASANSAGGVMGKMISLQSIAVGAAATGMRPSEEAKLFRFVLRHSITLALLIALITVFYAYVAPNWAP
jgi:L-lactate transport